MTQQQTLEHSSSLLVYQDTKTRLLLGGSVRQQSLQYQFTTRLTDLYSLLGVVATTTTRVVTTTGHHHWSPPLVTSLYSLLFEYLLLSFQYYLIKFKYT